MAARNLGSGRHRIFLFIQRSTPSRRPSRLSVSSASQCASIFRPILVRSPGADVEANQQALCRKHGNCVGCQTYLRAGISGVRSLAPGRHRVVPVHRARWALAPSG